MANTITKTTILDNARNLVQLINIVGDGSGEETNTVLVDRSTFAVVTDLELVVRKLAGLCIGFTTALSFDATTDLVFARLPDGVWFTHDWSEFGGISSNLSGAGAIGDILLTTSGLGAGDRATFLLAMRKQ